MLQNAIIQNIPKIYPSYTNVCQDIQNTRRRRGRPARSGPNDGYILDVFGYWYIFWYIVRYMSGMVVAYVLVYFWYIVLVLGGICLLMVVDILATWQVVDDALWRSWRHQEGRSSPSFIRIYSNFITFFSIFN